MKETKLIVSIFGLIISAYMLALSSIYRIFETISNEFSSYADYDTGDATYGGTAGLAFGILLLISGVIGCVVRDNKIVAILNAILYLVAAIIAFFFHYEFGALLFFGFISLAFGIFYALSILDWSKNPLFNKTGNTNQTNLANNQQNIPVENPINNSQDFKQPITNNQVNNQGTQGFTTNYQDDFFENDKQVPLGNTEPIPETEDLSFYPMKNFRLFKTENPKKRILDDYNTMIGLGPNSETIINIDKEYFTITKNGERKDFNLNKLKRFGRIPSDNGLGCFRIEYFDEFDPGYQDYVNIDFDSSEEGLIREIAQYLKEFKK